MTPAPAFDRAYASAKAQIVAGRWIPGQRVDLAEIAQELGTSLTPVRNALYRLLGERLLTGGPNDGFIIPIRTEPDLADLFGWSASLLGIALHASPRAHDAPIDPSEPLAERTRTLFERVAMWSGNGALETEMTSVNDRLHSARLAESVVFGDLEAEYDDLRQAIVDGVPNRIKIGLARYHRRRIRAAGQIVRAMHRPREQ